jgi:hypothetical protein
MHARIEGELPAPLRVLARRSDRPAGDDLGEIGDVRLGVPRAHAERMQLEDFACKVLVEALVLIAPGDRLRADRARVVEIKQHRRVALDRLQQIGEAAEHMRSNRLALVGAAHRTHRALVGGDAEMVRPEPYQPLDEAEVGTERGVDARLSLLEIDLLRESRQRGGLAGRNGLCRHRGLLGERRRRRGVLGGLALRALGKALRLAFLAEIERGTRGFAAREQIRVADAAGARPIELGEKRAARVGRYRGDRARPRTETEAMQGERCLRPGIARHGTSVPLFQFRRQKPRNLAISGIPTRH